MKKTGCIALACAVFLFSSCANDKMETDLCNGISYPETIRPLINARCAVSGCHVSGFQPGDFTRYEVLKLKADDGKLQLMVFELNLMPPAVKLTKEEKAVLKCWVEGGAKSN